VANAITSLSPVSELRELDESELDLVSGGQSIPPLNTSGSPVGASSLVPLYLTPSQVQALILYNQRISSSWFLPQFVL
jgi:hypothetical protein